MTALVADASALVDYLLRPGDAAPLERALLDPEVEVAVPELCDVEVVSALRRLIRLGRATPRWAERALGAYAALPLARYRHGVLLAAMLALRDRASAYDAAYLSLATLLDARLATTDRSLARAAAGLGLQVL